MENTQLSYQAKIKAIKDLRLFTNTSMDWDERYGNPANEQECKLLYMSLHKLAEKNYSIDLDIFMQDYKKSSKIYDGVFNKRKRTTIWKVENIEAFIKEVLKENPDFDFAKELVSKKYFDDFLDVDWALLLGWVHKKFPLFDSKEGDISTPKNKENIVFFKKRLTCFYPSHMQNKISPLMDMLFNQLNTASEVLRIDIYYFINQILSNISVLINKEMVHEFYNKIEWLDIPGINFEDGVIWKSEKKNEYWAFSQLVNGTFNLIQYKPDKTYIAYPITFMADSIDSCKLYVNKYDSIKSLCYNIPYDPDTSSFYHIDRNENQLCSEHLTGGLNILPSKLFKGKITSGFKDELEKYKNRYPQYAYSRRFLQTLYSEDYLFVEYSHKSVNTELQVIASWLRIPKVSCNSNLFSELHPNDPISLYCWDDKSFLFFDTLELSINLSNREELAKYQISIVPYPTVFVSKTADRIVVKGGELMDNNDENKVIVKSEATIWRNDKDYNCYNIIEAFENKQVNHTDTVESNYIHQIELEKIK